LSSQYQTGLLFAYSAANATGVSIIVNNLNSKPYVDLTLETLEAFNLKMPVNHGYEKFYFNDQPINHSTSQPFSFTIEGDWSNAAFLLVAAAITGNISVSGLNMSSVQGDKAIIDVLQQAGAKFEVKGDTIRIAESDLHGFEFDATDCPDLFPPLVALAANCKTVSKIRGVHRLLHKESNRAISLQKEFQKMNVPISIEHDAMLVETVDELSATEVFSHNDHRIAMACAVAGLKANGKIKIQEAEAVNKSYPNFWNDLQKLGAGVSLVE
ncbi:MAG: 3-phosphoshikimate 1-carboxyvinyltransferase, partial [Chitinophagaceae bacterium]|nr:3-phosphoshikimate 1-carboxyvinyltransferase [Chitinophagaceae bacterium]